jgi:hypothetical protein
MVFTKQQNGCDYHSATPRKFWYGNYNHTNATNNLVFTIPSALE